MIFDDRFSVGGQRQPCKTRRGAAETRKERVKGGKGRGLVEGERVGRRERVRGLDDEREKKRDSGEKQRDKERRDYSSERESDKSDRGASFCRASLPRHRKLLGAAEPIARARPSAPPRTPLRCRPTRFPGSKAFIKRPASKLRDDMCGLPKQKLRVVSSFKRIFKSHGKPKCETRCAHTYTPMRAAKRR